MNLCWTPASLKYVSGAPGIGILLSSVFRLIVEHQCTNNFQSKRLKELRNSHWQVNQNYQGKQHTPLSSI